MKSYQSVPTVSNDEDTSPPVEATSNLHTYAIVGVSVGVIVLILNSLLPSNGNVEELVGSSWPDFLVSRFDTFDKRPTDTSEALELGWEKSSDPCLPSLGQPWLYQGGHSIDSSVTLYFTPETITVPGALSGIEVDYYGAIEENQVGTYFSDERESNDGTYHSVAVALRKSDEQDLCSTEATLNPPTGKYLAIAPDMANTVIPTTNTSSVLMENWQEGSCIPRMGIHWIQDVDGGSDLSYKIENTVPVVAMYDPVDGEISAIFFAAPDRRQNWPTDVCALFQPEGYSPECLAAMNYWDVGPGLNQKNSPPLFMCSNFCGACEFTGSVDGIFATMHWFFKDTSSLACPSGPFPGAPYCASGDYPVLQFD